MLLHDHAKAYVRLVDGSRAYLDQFRFTIHALENFAGRELHESDLTAELVNNYLYATRESLSGRTRRSRRNMLRRVFIHATGTDLGKLAKVKTIPRPPQAWSLGQVRILLDAARRMRGKYRLLGPMKRDYWSAYILNGWDLGWSGCDLRGLSVADVDEGGNVLLNRAKTGKVVVGRLRTPARAALLSLKGQQPLMAWCGLSVWRRLAQRLVDEAGLPGAIGWLRHSAGTAAELAHPGQGYQFLGNTPGVFFGSYFDKRQMESLPQPPPLE